MPFRLTFGVLPFIPKQVLFAMKHYVRILGFAFFPLLVALSGCGEPRGKVSGKVTFKGKAVPGGTVVFVTEDDLRRADVPIQPDGSYSSVNVPAGNLRVGVMPGPKGLKDSMPKGVKMPKMPADNPAAKMYEGTGTYVDIPQELRDPATSKITVTVGRGEEKTFDIDVTKVK